MSDRWNVLFVHNSADLYGASRCILRLADRLLREGHRVTVVIPAEGPLAEPLRRTGAHVIVTRWLPVVNRQLKRPVELFKFLIGVPLSIVWFARLIRIIRPSLVHVNTSVMFTPVLAARVTRVPIIWHMREFFYEFPWLWRLYRPLITRMADAVVCVSEAVALQFPPGAGKVLTIYDGFPSSEFADVPHEEVVVFRRQHGLDSHALVSVIGRIKFGRKGQDVLARAAPEVAVRFPDVRFVCVGGIAPGNERHLTDLEALVDKLDLSDRWVITGDVPDARPAYAASEVILLTSALPEPFGGVVVEAMALGRPVIGTNIGGTPEQIVDGITGYLVKPNAPDQLAKRIIDLLEDKELRASMGIASRKRFLENFEYEEFHRRILEVYARVLAVGAERAA